MPQKVLLVQGGGDGAYGEDQALADYLIQTPGDHVEVVYPKFYGLETIDYPMWRSQAIDALKLPGDDAIVVAHSLGGAALIKVLAEESPILNILALYLVAMPYKCADGEWGTDDFAIATDFAKYLPYVRHLTLYHSDDDEWVPFDHMNQYAEKLSVATTVPLAGRGHSFMKQDFTELVEAIRSHINRP